MSDVVKDTFYIERNHFHRLSQSEEEMFIVIANETQFTFTKVQLFFIAPSIVKHFDASINPFFIKSKVHSNLVSCLTSVHSLFHTKSEIFFNDKSQSTFHYLSQVFNNPSLIENDSFYLSSKILATFSEKKLKKFNNFSINVNSTTFSVNFPLLCCVSDKLFNSTVSHQSLNLNVSDQVFNCISSFLNIFKGFPFEISHFEYSSLIELIDIFGLSCLAPHVSSKIPIPKTIKEAFDFCSKFDSNQFPEISSRCLSIIAKNFDQVSFNELDCCSVSFLFQLFSHENLIVSTEDEVFQTVIGLIKNDDNRLQLLTTIKFSYVSSPLLKQFFQNFPFQELDEDLFNCLKERLFADVFITSSSKRWKNKLTLMSRSELIELLSILDRTPFNSTSPTEKLKKLIQNFSKNEKEIQKLRSEKKELQRKLSFFQTEVAKLERNAFELQFPHLPDLAVDPWNPNLLPRRAETFFQMDNVIPMRIEPEIRSSSSSSFDEFNTQSLRSHIEDNMNSSNDEMEGLFDLLQGNPNDNRKTIEFVDDDGFHSSDSF